MGQQSVSQHFVRDKLTWFGYLLIGNYGYSMSTLGPLMPFLKTELGISYTVAAYHFSAWAFGSLISGSIGDKTLGWLGIRRTIWICALGFTSSWALFLNAHHVWITVPSILLCGVWASTLGQAVNTMNAERFGDERAIAMTETNIVASLFCAAGPAVVGLFLKLGLGWRLALVLPIMQFLFFVAFFWRTAIPEAPVHQRAKGTACLPLSYWMYWIVMLLMVACEWSFIFWSAEFFRQDCKLSKADASQAVSVFLAAMLIGRIVGSRLTRKMTTSQLLPASSMIAITGFLIFWLSPLAWINIAGLFVAGLGIANFYPLTLAAAIGAVPGHSAVATARLSLGTGSAILLAPLLLGMVADHFGIFVAYGLIGALLLAAVFLVFVANSAARNHAAGALSPAIVASEV